MMDILHMDLDNTLIYSYKRNIGNMKRNVELYQGRKISYLSDRTYELLCKVNERMLMVPTTTRTMEQYNRIRLGRVRPRFALVCNGGILLENGVRDSDWYSETRELISESIPEMENALGLLEKEERREFELRYIEEMFLFTKCREAEQVVQKLNECLDGDLVNVFQNREKVYVVPVALTKGKALERFKERIPCGKRIAAGDSEFDISMLKAADFGMAPFGFGRKYGIDFHVEEAPEETLFSEYFLERCLDIGNNRHETSFN